jgi:cell filamentation protein
MYAAIDDPYCYRGTNVLRNRLDIRTNEQLAAFEEEIVKQRAEEPLPTGTLSVSQYSAIHRHLFQDVYSWAGHFRTVRVAKGGSLFAYPEHVPAGMRDPVCLAPPAEWLEAALAGCLRHRWGAFPGRTERPASVS